MSFTKVKDIVDSQISVGAERQYSFRKASAQSAAAGYWFDMSMSAGNPIAKYWFDAAPYTATQVKQSTDGGIFHGSAVSPKQKVLRELMMFCNSSQPLPMQVLLCDYLLYYPTIDDSITDPQIMINNVGLPRYTSGEGVQIMAISIATRTGTQTFTINYTNSDGVADRITPNVLQNTQTPIGIVLNSSSNQAGTTGASSGAFIRLQEGDKGVQSIQSVTMNGADIGLFALVLVKPLASLQMLNADAAAEVDYLKDYSSMPVIQDDAYLNFLIAPQGSILTLPITGLIKTTFN